MRKSHANDLTQGPIARGLLRFAAPLFIGQLLQQLYSTVDAWVLGNFESAQGLAAVTAVGSLTFLIIGFFNGIAIGGSVVISRYFGQKDAKSTQDAMYANFIFGLIASVLATVVGTIFAPHLLRLMATPEQIMPGALSYLRIYFLGISTVIMYNSCMAIMRAVGDSMHPLYYLAVSCITNIVLDLLFVIVFKWSVAGTAIATVISQALSCILCMVHMQRAQDETHLDLRHLRWARGMMGEIIRQGLPMGIQNSVISIGNMTVQGNFNLYDQMYAGGQGLVMAGQGAYSKLEGLGFLPITCMSMSLPTFISQNIGAKKYDRVRKSARFGILAGVVMAAVLGVFFYLFAPLCMQLFVKNPAAIEYGVIHARTTGFFFGMLACCHCTAGVLRGCGKAVIPMAAMLSCWCVIRVIYVTIAMGIRPAYSTIAAAYPITWTLCAILLCISLYRVMRKGALEGVH